MGKPTSVKEQIKITLFLCHAIIVFILIITGSDVYITRFNVSHWIKIILNIVSALLSVAAAGAFLHYYAPLNKKE
jgi:hypothetical protein